VLCGTSNETQEHPDLVTIMLSYMGSPRLSRWTLVWVVLGLGGLAIAGLGALLLGSAWDGYIAANPGYRGDGASPPPASSAVGTEASLALAMLAVGYLIALIASFMRLRTRRGRWMLLKALAALVPIALWWLWLGHFFRFWAYYFCGDCSPPQPLIPDVFTFGNNVLVGAAFLALILFLVFFALAIFTFVRTRRRPAHLPPR
jgi:hypothetical protein